MALKHIKAKIRATDRIRKVTKAMEAVSAVKMRKSQERALAGRPYAQSAFRILSKLSHTQALKSHPFLVQREKGKVAVIVVTSDKGLAGNLNSSVIKKAVEFLKSRNLSPRDVSFVCFGKKGYEFFSRRGYDVIFSSTNIKDGISLSELEEVSRQVIGKFSDAAFSEVVVVYQRFVTTFLQESVERRILPLSPEVMKGMIEDITPAHGRYSNTASEVTPAFYTVEPETNEVLDAILENLVRVAIYHALLENKASEHSARMVAMKNASDKARDVSKALTLQFNKARQAAITREVSEITGGIEAMNNS